MKSQRPWRNGCVFVSCTAVPVEARMCEKNRGDDTWDASSRRFRSFHAGWTLRYSAGSGRTPSYQPTPKPSPFVVVAPSREWRLWSISEYFRWTMSASSGIGSPE